MENTSTGFKWQGNTIKTNANESLDFPKCLWHIFTYKHTDQMYNNIKTHKGFEIGGSNNAQFGA